MQDSARAQIRLILEDETERSDRACERAIANLVSEHAAKGLLKSGGAIKIAMRLIDDEAGKYVAAIVDKVAPIAKDIEAFAMIRESFVRFEPTLAEHFDRATSLAAGSKATQPSDSASRAARALYAEALKRWERQLELHRFAFTVPASREPLPSFEAPPRAETVATKNRGGKPLAGHWDAMWAEIAVQLWNGDLKPTRQADITKAMNAWLAERDIDVGQTAVTDRARALWQRIEAAERG